MSKYESNNMRRFYYSLEKVLLLVINLHAANFVASEKPNIVFIIADDYGFNDIGYHAVNHLSDIKTPFLDYLAANGIKLENYYVQPICTPSRSQLMSGRYQIHTGLQHGVIETQQPNGLPLDNILLPQQLKNCGYNTHMVGKWHLGFFKEDYLPWKRGFDSFFGYLGSSEDYYLKLKCEISGCGIDMDSQNGPTNDTYGKYSAHLYVDKTKEVIDKHNKSNPMFLYIAFQSVHSPLQVPESYTKNYSHINDISRRSYAGMVATLDEAVRNITEHLQTANMWDNTLLVFTTDNGGETQAGGNNWPLRGKKNTLWEGGIRGVGFIHGMMLNVQNRVNMELMHISDWYPTLMSAAQCSMMSGTQPLDGYDQWQSINAKTKSPRTELLHNIDPYHHRTFTSKLNFSHIRMGFDISVNAGIRVGDWKLLTGSQGDDRWIKPAEANNDDYSTIDEVESMNFSIEQYQARLVQLFNIKYDPYERVEVSGLYPDVVNELLTKLAKYNATAVPVSYPPNDFNASPKKHGGFWQPWIK